MDFSNPNFTNLFGGGINARSDANDNWNKSRDYGLSSGNHWSLPNGNHHMGNTTITRGD